MINKLNIYQGGIENRFIPSLSADTKHLIEGFFKISNDEILRNYALAKPEEITLEEDDSMLTKIIVGGEEDEFEDYTDLTISCLHQAMLQKVPIITIARIGGKDGMRLTRAAFAVILKYSETIEKFNCLVTDVEISAVSVPEDMTGTNRLKEIIKELKTNKDFEVLCKKWESASNIRKWT